MSIRSVDAVERSVHKTNDRLAADEAVKLRHRGEFLIGFVERAQLGDPEAAPHAVRAATRVLARNVTAGELDDVLSELSSEIREVVQL
jgi:uncharacterized protein (DUF2267 family)